MNNELNDATQRIDSTMIVDAQNPDATMMGVSVKCPICGIENAPGEKYCGDCGFLLSSMPSDEVAAFETADQVKLINKVSSQEYYLNAGENTIGREMSDVSLNDPTVSRKHARIIVEENRCLIEDLGSTNGTMVKGAKISSTTEIFDGDEITFGSVVLAINIPAVEANGEKAESTAPSVDAESEPSTEVIADDAEISDEEAPVPSAKLVSVKDASKEFMIYSGVNTIGRRAGNSIQILDDPYVSGAHAEITDDEGWFGIVDLGSTNGTIVNGVKLEPQMPLELNDGDEIVFGRTQFYIKLLG
jgi:pSer/pThr/pTyr-binding forkhead associated (FHA) protein